MNKNIRKCNYPVYKSSLITCGYQITYDKRKIKICGCKNDISCEYLEKLKDEVKRNKK